MITFTSSAESKLLECRSDNVLNSAVLEELAERSYDDERGFFLELIEAVQSRDGLESHSAPFESYNFYQDLIVRHVGKKLIAFKTWENDTWREWSYDYLHRLVNYQISRWKNQQEDWSGNVAIAISLGIHFLVAVLTAIRLGLTFTVLPLDSPALPPKKVRALLDQLKVEVIFTSPEASSTLTGDERHWLIEYLEESDKYEPEEDKVYQPEECFQQAFALHLQDQHALVPVSAEEMYLNAIRDAQLVFGLKRGSTFGYSPDCSLREQPYIILAGLLAGAKSVILPYDKLKVEPTLASSESIEVLGVTAKLRDLWTEEDGMPKSGLTGWYYNLFDDDPKAWSRFIEKNALEKHIPRRLIINNANAGVTVSSIKVVDEPRETLWPAFGKKWDLLQYGQQDVLSVQPYGVFKQHSLADAPSNLLLTRLGVGWEIATTITPQKRGYTIPIPELEKTVEQLEFVEFAYFLTLQIPYSRLRTQSVLAVFVNPLFWDEVPNQKAAWKQQVDEAIATELGTLFIPDKVEFFPLIPRVENGALDRNWCYQQYSTGLFHRKQSLKIYHWLSLLKKAALEL